MPIPNYHKNTIVNLMSSILKGLNANSDYNDLPNITKEVKQAQNIVLFIIDGMGLDSIQQLEKNNILRKNCLQQINSVFPSATAASITSFMTGLSPQQHGITAWYMKMKEFNDQVVAILPYYNRKKEPLSKSIKLKMPENIFQKINADSHMIYKKNLLKSKYNIHFGKKAKKWGINNLRSLTSTIRKISLKKNKNKQYIYAYWGEFDDFSHHYGKNHSKSKTLLKEINNKIEHLAKTLKNSNTLLLITADHGQIITTKQKTIILNKHPKLMECLSSNLCGEPRAAFCYVHPHKRQQFEQYVKHHLKYYCTLYHAEELVQQNYFGLGQEHFLFRERIGDYILITKENYILKEFLPQEEHKTHIGNHGGTSEQEMHIPLIMIKC